MQGIAPLAGGGVFGIHLFEARGARAVDGEISLFRFTSGCSRMGGWPLAMQISLRTIWARDFMVVKLLLQTMKLRLLGRSSYKYLPGRPFVVGV